MTVAEERHVIRGIPALVRSTSVRGPSLVRSESLVTISSHFSAVPAQKWYRNVSTSLRTAGRDDRGKVVDSGVADGSVSDSESECGDYGSTGVRGIAEPPSCGQVSSYFGPLESFAESCKNDEAAHSLLQARMSFFKAYASKPARQADIRKFWSE